MRARTPRAGWPVWTRLLGAMLGAVLLVVGPLPTSSAAAPAEDADGASGSSLFWAEGCPYCARKRTWLPSMQEAFPELEVRQYEVTRSAEHRALLEQRAAAAGTVVSGVPMTFLSDRGGPGSRRGSPTASG